MKTTRSARSAARKVGPLAAALLVTGGVTAIMPLPGAAKKPPMAAPVPPPRADPLFVNTVWKVKSSKQVAPGQLYVFLSEGTLVVASPKGKPSLGSWTYRNRVLTLTEEGRPYRAEILALTARAFRLRIKGPGAPVEMTLVPARPH